MPLPDHSRQQHSFLDVDQVVPAHQDYEQIQEEPILYLYQAQTHQQTQPTQQRHRLEANRYYTPVLVEVYQDDRLRRVKWFSDLQLAHIWCMEEVESYPEEDWLQVHRCFPDFADAMDERWRQGTSGKRAAYSDYYEYRVCYEPINSELLRNEGIDE